MIGRWPWRSSQALFYEDDEDHLEDRSGGSRRDIPPETFAFRNSARQLNVLEKDGWITPGLSAFVETAEGLAGRGIVKSNSKLAPADVSALVGVPEA
jgi:hypothetical protein